MIDLIYRAGPFGDCTSGYDVSVPEGMTVEEFIKAVVAERPNEWGKITCGRCSLADYKRGEIHYSPDYEELKSARAATISAHGGWSLMDYNIVIHPMKPKLRLRPTIKPASGFRF